MTDVGILRQILLITDGCSNVGTDPVYVAQSARARGLTTSVIGVLDDGALGERGRREAENIADAGGGMCRIVRARDLSQTVQMVTRQTMQLTLHQVVNAELRQIIGGEETDLPPETRARVAGAVMQMSEQMRVDMALVIDMSASMQSKKGAVCDAIRDLEFGLEARAGAYRLIVVTYPGAGGESADLHGETWADASIADIIAGLRPAGNTPTGPALETAVTALLAGADVPDVRGHVV
ncbi:MAG: hypothetical protein OWT27_03865 [Firmicutes bacterium]|nr:hypothetical protein [Bacillota bacterium]